MSDIALKLALLLALLAWSGHLSYRLSSGILDAWRSRRFGVSVKGSKAIRCVRVAARPMEFWFAIIVWVLMLAVFIAVFALGVYGIWRVLLAPARG